MIKHICGSDIIQSKRIRDGKIIIRIYNYNNEHLEFHNKLASYYSNKHIILDLFEDNIINKKIDDKITKITLNKLEFDLDELLSYIKDGKSFLKPYLYSIHIDKNINFYHRFS